MANYLPDVWRQLKNLTADDLVSALKRDGWELEATNRQGYTFTRHYPFRRVAIHYHPRKTYRENLLKDLLDDIGWSVDDLVRLKLVKVRGQRDSSR